VNAPVVPEPLLREAVPGDAARVVGLVNYYAATGFAAFSSIPISLDFYAELCEGAYACYVLEDAGYVVGFGCMRPLLPFPAFRAAVLLSYFIAPGYTGRGLGTRLLGRLAADAKAFGCSALVVNVSSRNGTSLRFHEKHGFVETGRLRNVGVKFGMPFDLVWLQREA